MDCEALQQLLHNGEDSRHQFKVQFESIDKLAVEISAFANSQGGRLVIGVTDHGDVRGIEKAELSRLNNWISNATSQKIEPPIFVTTEIVSCENKRVLIIDVPRGHHKPYAVNKSEFWVKNGADKRRATREELLRLMQASGSVYADEVLTNSTLDEFDRDAFARFYKAYYQEPLEELVIPLPQLLENFKLAEAERLTLAGLLLFGKHVEFTKPQFGVKATYYETSDLFRDKEDIGGTLTQQFTGAVAFIERNLRRVQKNADFNSPGMLEIPLPVIKEVIANALVHRDYFLNTSIFVNLDASKVEVCSPGVLPNTVTIENIKSGIHMERNPILLSYMAKDPLFGYTGRGSGIPRILRICQENELEVEFKNDTLKNQFTVTILRKLSAAG
jgi:ATP-dependent DNA helicase RecG